MAKSLSGRLTARARPLLCPHVQRNLLRRPSSWHLSICIHFSEGKRPCNAGHVHLRKISQCTIWSPWHVKKSTRHRRSICIQSCLLYRTERGLAGSGAALIGGVRLEGHSSRAQATPCDPTPERWAPCCSCCGRFNRLFLTLQCSYYDASFTGILCFRGGKVSLMEGKTWSFVIDLCNFTHTLFYTMLHDSVLI